ncbi:hypothetical protein [Prosthecobacter sp.]|uniref:hypothetical protein n=1 Tax=Prosthecobacter sp. TaxID=1965333 RepID=UPI001D6DCBD6|nr:hypothetical protein [Prosthecobacter sp.]MCB1279220.1 hypothetical protein [Prosthecobacter sp.]
MKTAPVFLALLLASILPASASDRLEQWYNLMPKNTVGVIAIKNTPELLADWEKSSYAKFMQDDEAKRWMAPMRKDGEAPWDKFFKETYGGGMHDTLKDYPGARVSYLVVNDFAELAKDPPNVSLCEIAGKQKEIEAHKLAEVESKKKENEKLKLHSEDIGGVNVQIASEGEGNDAAWAVAWAVVGDVMIEANTRGLMEYMIGALKNNAGDPPGVAREHLTRIGQITNGGGDAMLYFNGVKLLELGEQALAAAEAAKKDEKKAPGFSFDIKPKQIMDMLGAQELQAVAFTAELTDSQSRMDMTILHPAKPAGLISLMRGSGNEVTLPQFIPAGVLTASVARIDFGTVYDAILGMVTKLGPMAMMITMQVPQLEAQMGFKIRDDLFGSLEDEVLQVQDGDGGQESQVMGFKVKDADKLGGALEGLKRFAGAGFGAFEESDFLGYNINTLKTSQTANTATEIAYCNTGKYLLISVGKQDTLKKVLGRMKDPSGPSIWDDAQVQTLLSLVPKNYSGVGVTDAGRLLNMIATAAATLESKAGNKKAAAKKKGPGKKAIAPEEAVAATSAGWFDSSARPSNETFRRYFGSLLSASYALPDAVQFHYLTTPVEVK